ncbi:hypothetical protein pdam_00005750 [Pocillopora damicornis]|uniref:Uncharacterized protein n=1 Tax=Pocillopora damicornis TaxID=46731 RepID=A0A3M6UVA4_POCDA|nr:hypothetical protein pdam_00005750 [Pocillopora damicornis]
MLSSVSPAKTKNTPSHWRVISEFPNKSTEARIVKNLRVVVIMEQIMYGYHREKLHVDHFWESKD